MGFMTIVHKKVLYQLFHQPDKVETLALERALEDPLLVGEVGEEVATVLDCLLCGIELGHLDGVARGLGQSLSPTFIIN